MIDSHCHLNSIKKNKEEVLTETKIKGVNTILNLDSLLEYENSNDLVTIGKKHSIRILNAAGIHPLYIRKISKEETEKKLKLASNDLVAFGETGIDLYYDNNLTEQLDYFNLHCELAQKLNKTIIVHSRDVNIKIILQELTQYKIKGIFHSFNHDISSMFQAVDKGFFISFSGMITFKKSDSLREAAKECPIEKILIETDSPFLAPSPLRGKENSPAYVPYIYKYISEIKQLNLVEFIEKIKGNFDEIFPE